MMELYTCPQCNKPTKFRGMCNRCIDKFMAELDRDLAEMYPIRTVVMNPFKYVWQKLLSRKRRSKCPTKMTNKR